MDLILRNVLLQDNEPLVDIGVKDGKIVAIEPNLNAKAAEEIDGEGRVVIPGLVESHIHLDKALVADRKANRSGTLWEALSVTAELKPTFTKEDIYDRAKRALLMEIAAGTTHLRAHSEFDPIGGFGGFEVTMALKQEFKHAIDIQVVAFPQEGIIKSPGTDKMMIQAMEAGADVVGGVPYVEPDPRKHIDIIFEIAKKFDKDLDIHQDFFDNWENTTLEYLCDKTLAEGYVGRVSVGHLTALGALTPEQAKPIIEKMAQCEMNVMPLPATDLHLGGRKDQGNVRRALAPIRALRDSGVNVCIGSNNIRNA
ncbi:MAG TPA: amidohydrolase family protein, partial [Symbiobacteriaceae bacterium]|nr:amidohydrolase family protein [Symbiobacteriaceae bacterium]